MLCCWQCQRTLHTMWDGHLFIWSNYGRHPTAVITIIKGHTDQLPGYLCSLYYFCEKQGGLEFIFNSWVRKSHNKIHIFSYWKFNLKRPFQTAHMIALDQPTIPVMAVLTLTGVMMNTAFRAEPANNYGSDDWRVVFMRADHKRIKNQTCGTQ